MIDSGSAEQIARDRLGEIGFAETERRMAAKDTRIAELERERDVLAAKLDVLRSDRETGDLSPEQDEAWLRSQGFDLLADALYVGDIDKILTARDTAQRKAGALWALDYVLAHWAGYEGSLWSNLNRLKQRVEHGEVEVKP